MERPDLAKELEELAAVDLAVRQRLVDSGELFNGYNAEMRAVHEHNGARLTEILDDLRRWPGRSVVGEAGAQAAFLIAQHDIGNPTLMRRSSRLVDMAVDDADVDPTHVAYLHDRIRYLEGRLQRYGTQMGWDDDGTYGPWPEIEYPEWVDERRTRLGLPPFAEAVAAARQNRPAQRSVEDIRDDYRRAEDFAHQAGWRAPKTMLYLLCGLPGSGKTTRANDLARAGKGIILNADCWVCELYPDDAEAAARDDRKARVEAVQWELAERLLAHETSVILDWGMWTRAERDEYRRRTHEIGVTVELVFTDAPLATLHERIANRNRHLPAGTFNVSSEELDEWAELFEPPTVEELLRNTDGEQVDR